MAVAKWTRKHNKYVIENYPKQSPKEIAEHFGISVARVGWYISLLRDEGKITGYHKCEYRPWTMDEIKYLLQFYETDGDFKIGLALDRSRSAVRNQYRYLRRKQAK